MARPSKITVSTIPLSVDFFESKEMVCIAGEFGVKGEITALKLLFAVHHNGYFLKWSEYQRALMIRLLPGVSPELLDQILDRLVKRGFFDSNLFDSAHILTSVDIQRKYFNAIKRRVGIDKLSFPYLLLDPVRPNDISAYRNGVSVINNGVYVSNNGKIDADTEVYVINKGISANNNENYNAPDRGVNESEKGFLHTETGVSVYNNSGKGNKNVNSGKKNIDSCNRNPLENHFVTQKEFQHTETGVSVINNSDSCKQKPKRHQNNNSNNVTNKRNNVDNNPITADDNGETDNNNSDSDSNNHSNIIYNNSCSSISSRSSSCCKTREQKIEFGEQKGIESFQDFEEALKDLKSHKTWRESICMNNQIDQQELDSLLEKFSINCKAEGKTRHSSMQELMSHFNRWIPYSNINQLNKSKQHHGTDETKPKTRNQSRRTDITSERQENYHTTF